MCNVVAYIYLGKLLCILHIVAVTKLLRVLHIVAGVTFT